MFFRLIVIGVVVTAIAVSTGAVDKAKLAWTNYKQLKIDGEKKERALTIQQRFEEVYQPPAGCRNPGSSLKALECKNAREREFASFKRLFKPL